MEQNHRKNSWNQTPGWDYSWNTDHSELQLYTTRCLQARAMECVQAKLFSQFKKIYKNISTNPICLGLGGIRYTGVFGEKTGWFFNTVKTTSLKFNTFEYL
jgi:hypothetical protein